MKNKADLIPSPSLSAKDWAREAKYTILYGPFQERLAEALMEMTSFPSPLSKRLSTIRERLFYLYTKGYIKQYDADVFDHPARPSLKVEYVGYEGDSHIIVFHYAGEK
jgi:hypothetical protein